MKVRVFTLRWDDAAGKFDDREFRAFIDEDPGRDVLEVSDHFFVHDRRPAWAFMVMFREAAELGTARRNRNNKKDWRGELDEPGRKIYDELRTWRSRAAKREGVPPYLICNGVELF